MTGAFQARRAAVGVTANRHLHDGVHRDWLRRRYLEALHDHALVECVILPTIDGKLPWEATVETFRDLLPRLDGLVLTGDESNLDPNIFNETERSWHRADDDVIPGVRDRPRDRLSRVALTVAIELEMPILGICRGLQEMNVHRNGTLYEDLSLQNKGVVHHENPNLPRDQQYLPVHAVKVVPGGILSSIVGDSELFVNSLHNQGIADTASTIRVEAVANDGVVEALSYPTSATFQLALQWHPEWHASTDVNSQKIFQAFGDACRAYQTERAEKWRQSALA
ncbi:gamma-glutamyl-gamma-aminobutyrate hydrolase family protein [Trinickia diaoshuihuensis]|uniref:gamma-glutamyl-gamma-aminobutyrate hydrolase family protein n=1 Tax=Trinickia diaoshuihuensis TaxID=2292265 RepID=UPI000E23D460|nr:gamma-glutamyl-gamma-aminobutyrate hydrolase family protein [Trinickia diaoshuihuensis]